jgi:hypothetical protein
MRGIASRRRSAAIAAIAVLFSFAPSESASSDVEELIGFGAQMASKGNWREARFRWEQAARLDPKNARVLNNLAAAHEVLGDPDTARDLYAKALTLSGNDARIADNASRSSRFWEEARADSDKDEVPSSAFPPAAKPKKGSDAIHVPVSLPLPARLDLSRMKNLLVASFLVNDSDLLDVNREMVRFLRSEFRKHTGLKVLDITPPPAIPEQAVDDLVRNRAFWTHLGREFSADLVVSGVVRYTRRDASGFQEVDVVSPSTGQKVRETQFVEQEQFQFQFEVFFFDGGTGDLLFRDRFQRQALFQGSMNDPITAFYGLSDTISEDVLSVVAPRRREDFRVIFKA